MQHTVLFFSVHFLSDHGWKLSFFLLYYYSVLCGIPKAIFGIAEVNAQKD